MKLIEFLKEDDDIYRAYNKADMVAQEIRQSNSAPIVFVSMKKLHQYIKSLGFDIIGKGAFATVFSKQESSYVLKVVGPSELNCTAGYLALGRAANKNKHIPRVLKLKKIKAPYKGGQYKKGNEPVILVAAIEKLKPLDLSKLRLTKDKKYNYGLIAFLAMHIFDISDELVFHDGDRTSQIDQLIGGRKKIAELIINYDNGNLFNKLTSGYSIISQIKDPDEFLEAIQKHTDIQMGLRGIAKSWVQKYRNTPFVNAFEIIRNFRMKFERCGIDLHEGNLMMREDGTIVITDPVTG